MTITKNELNYYASLLIKKDRDNERKFIVEGQKIFEEGIKSNLKPEHVFLINEIAESNKKFLDQIISKKIKFSILSNKEFKKITDTKNPQGIASIFLKPDEYQIESLNGDLIVCLDNVSDPGNVGTIIRNCDWFGVKEIILSEGSADVYNPKTIRASMGSIFHCSFLEGKDLKSILPKLKMNGYTIFCSDLNGTNIIDLNVSNKNIIIFSNEASGPSQDVLDIADDKITIPKYGNAESLNVASASAIILAELKNHVPRIF